MRPIASVLVAGLAAPAIAAASLLALALLSPARDAGPAAVQVEPGEFMHRPSGERLGGGRAAAGQSGFPAGSGGDRSARLDG